MVEEFIGRKFAAFLDTNLLIHGRNLEELPWRDIAPNADDIEIQIGITVVRELDRHKSDGNSRRARRAKKAKVIFSELRMLPGRIKVLNESNPTVVLRLMPRVQIAWEDHPELDRAYADDTLVAEALAHRTSDRTSIVVSHDDGLLMTADQFGLATFEIPKSWLLEPESDERDKEIKSLRLEIASLKSERNSPELTFEFIDDDDKVIDKIGISVFKFKSPTDEGIKCAMEELKRRRPKASLSIGQPGKSAGNPDENLINGTMDLGNLEWYGLTALDIANYSKEYDEFLVNYQKIMRGISSGLENSNRFCGFGFRVGNNGRAPAEGLEVAIEVMGGPLILCRELPEWKPPAVPSAPLPPDKARALRWVQARDPLASTFRDPFLNNYRSPAARDPQSFYWSGTGGRPYWTEAIISCEDFRHNKIYEGTIAAGAIKNSANSVKGAIKATLSCRNLPTKVEKILPVSIFIQDADPEEYLLKAGFRKEFIEIFNISLK